MKKRLLALLLASAMVFCNASIVFAAEENVTVAEETPEYHYVSPADAVTAAAEDTAYILDVRLYENYAAGRITNSTWCPQFPMDDESLDDTVETLLQLQDSGRLVGVISHVAELKERIPAHLVVSSGKRGSQAHFEVRE